MPEDNQNQGTQPNGNSGAGSGASDTGQASSTGGSPFKFGSTILPASEMRSNILHADHPNLPYTPPPPPTGQPPYHLSLEAFLSVEQMAAINTEGRLVFHMAGDTGGVNRPEVQQIVVLKMVDDWNTPNAAAPSFFYHLGDVVYYNGEASGYEPQFYEAYKPYHLPIFAIPGNHDAASAPSLAPFVNNFCASTPQITKDAGDAWRTAMIQSNVYWTLEAPFVTIIGLYTNLPEGGQLDAVHENTQMAWLESELANAPTDKALIVALHHPVYSLDIFHVGSTRMKNVLDDAIQKTGRTPDAIFSAHVHNYQRYTRKLNGRDVPYIVAGAGGYWFLHAMRKNLQGQMIKTPFAVPDDPSTTLEAYRDDRHGFLRLEISEQIFKGTYFVVPRPQEHWKDPAQLADTFVLDLKTHQLVLSQGVSSQGGTAQESSQGTSSQDASSQGG